MLPSIKAGEKYRGARKVYSPRNQDVVPLKNLSAKKIAKPAWIRTSYQASTQVTRIKNILRQHKLSSVCEEARCPNLNECFSKGTATFMILGDICTRRCAFCDVAHGIPKAVDTNEPYRLATAIKAMGLRYVVITSVDRDDLADGGADHFAACIQMVREHNPGIHVEILVPDFKNKMLVALKVLLATPPDVFNHNLETVPALYKKVRPGANYEGSLRLLQEYKKQAPHIVTKSGLMLGLGETTAQLKQVFLDMRIHQIDMLTLGQYLQPSVHHLAVHRFVPPEEFESLGAMARDMGFTRVASGPLVRSSYHAEEQIKLK